MLGIKKINYIKVICLVFVLLISLSTISLAQSYVYEIGEEQTAKLSVAQNNLFILAGIAIGFLQIAGIAISIIVLLILGISWFWSGAKQKAALKSKIGIYILGMFLLLSGPLVLKLVLTILQTVL